jgi:hypothetical protein
MFSDHFFGVSSSLTLVHHMPLLALTRIRLKVSDNQLIVPE